MTDHSSHTHTHKYVALACHFKVARSVAMESEKHPNELRQLNTLMLMC